jgi:hypothetical protein
MRIDMALGEQEDFYSYEKGWKLWEREDREHVATSREQGAESSDPVGRGAPQALTSGVLSPTNIRYPYKIVSSQKPDHGYYIEPNHGQFADQSRGDHATLYVTKFKPQEGDKDLLTLGSCCDLSDDGVERYLKESEMITGTHIVLWYVPRIRNDAREGHEYCWADTIIGDDGNLDIKVWPCTVGPKFIPIKENIK